MRAQKTHTKPRGPCRVRPLRQRPNRYKCSSDSNYCANASIPWQDAPHCVAFMPHTKTGSRTHAAEISVTTTVVAGSTWTVVVGAWYRYGTDVALIVTIEEQHFFFVCRQQQMGVISLLFCINLYNQDKHPINPLTSSLFISSTVHNGRSTARDLRLFRYHKLTLCTQFFVLLSLRIPAFLRAISGGGNVPVDSSHYVTSFPYFATLLSIYP